MKLNLEKTLSLTLEITKGEKFMKDDNEELKEIKVSIKHMKIAIIVTIIILLISPIVHRVIINATSTTNYGGRIWDSIYIKIDKPNENYKVTFSVDNLKSENELNYYRDYFDIEEIISNDGKKTYKINVPSEYRNDVKIYVYKDEMLINSFNFNEIVRDVPGREYDYNFIYQTDTQQLIDIDQRAYDINGFEIELPKIIAYLTSRLLFIVLIIEIVVYIKLRKKLSKLKENN